MTWEVAWGLSEWVLDWEDLPLRLSHTFATFSLGQSNRAPLDLAFIHLQNGQGELEKGVYSLVRAESSGPITASPGSALSLEGACCS